jgi:ATP-dependent 26S proteasome regulatory subunit
LSQDGGCDNEVNLLYKTVEGTKWNIESVGAVDQKESSQNENNCSLALVGGLQNVIKELREIMQFALKGSPLFQGMYGFGSRRFTQQCQRN